MRLHFVLSTESLVTFTARERFLASVNPDVFVTVMFQGELFRAEPTLVGFFSRVSSHVKFTVCLERKPLGAELALMGSHPEMSILYMGVTVGLGGKGHGAILTQIRFLSCVDSNVRFDVANLPEGFGAHQTNECALGLGPVSSALERLPFNVPVLCFDKELLPFLKCEWPIDVFQDDRRVRDVWERNGSVLFDIHTRREGKIEWKVI